MATKTKKKTAKKAVKKVAKQAAPLSGAAALQAFRAAIQNLKAAGSALAKAARANPKLGSTVGVRTALNSLLDAAAAIDKSIPVEPPTTTVFQGGSKGNP